MRLWLISEHFGGDLRSARAGWPFLPPLGVACWRGELNVCKWLYGHGAAPDITRANEYGATPMIMACEQGHMSVCKWLFGVGGVEVVELVDEVHHLDPDDALALLGRHSRHLPT